MFIHIKLQCRVLGIYLVYLKYTIKYYNNEILIGQFLQSKQSMTLVCFAMYQLPLSFNLYHLYSNDTKPSYHKCFVLSNIVFWAILPDCFLKHPYARLMLTAVVTGHVPSTHVSIVGMVILGSGVKHVRRTITWKF